MSSGRKPAESKRSRLAFCLVSLSHIGYFFSGVFQIVRSQITRAQTLGSSLGPQVEVGIVERCVHIPRGAIMHHFFDDLFYEPPCAGVAPNSFSKPAAL